MKLMERAGVYSALGDPRRLAMVDQLGVGDRTVAELGEISGMSGNLLAHHLDVLQTAEVIERRVSEGDHRRKYVSLRWDRLPPGLQASDPIVEDVVFVCTHNSARSQFAAALWERATGRRADSAGNMPASRVNPKAVRVAGEFGIDLSSAEPRGYDQLPGDPDLIVSVCDRAREAGVPAGRRLVHWSVPDPVERGTLGAFRNAFSEIAQRMDHLTGESR